MNLYYKRDGRPYVGKNAALQWSKDVEKTNRRVLESNLPNGLWVSTVWLGLDYSLGLSGGKPLIFETMIFTSKDNLHSLDCERYSTETEAIKGHKRLSEIWSRYRPIK